MKIEELKSTIALVGALKPTIGYLGGRYLTAIGLNIPKNYYIYQIFRELDGDEDPTLVLDLIGKFKKLDKQADVLLENASPFIKLVTKIRQFIGNLRFGMFFDADKALKDKFNESLEFASVAFSNRLDEKKDLSDDDLKRALNDFVATFTDSEKSKSHYKDFVTQYFSENLRSRYSKLGIYYAYRR